MEAFSALLTLCAENSPVTGEFPSQKPVTRSFDVFFEQTVVQAIETPLIWDAIALIMTSLQWSIPDGNKKVVKSTRRWVQLINPQCRHMTEVFANLTGWFM